MFVPLGALGTIVTVWALPGKAVPNNARKEMGAISIDFRIRERGAFRTHERSGTTVPGMAQHAWRDSAVVMDLSPLNFF